MGAQGEGVQFKLSMVPVLRPRFLTRWEVPRQRSTLHESVGTRCSILELGVPSQTGSTQCQRADNHRHFCHDTVVNPLGNDQGPSKNRTGSPDN